MQRNASRNSPYIRYQITEMERGETEKIVETNLTRNEVNNVLLKLRNDNYNIIPRPDGFVCDSSDGTVSFYIMRMMSSYV